jgi:hypothetical protein
LQIFHNLHPSERQTTVPTKKIIGSDNLKKLQMHQSGKPHPTPSHPMEEAQRLSDKTHRPKPTTLVSKKLKIISNRQTHVYPISKPPVKN